VQRSRPTHASGVRSGALFVALTTAASVYAQPSLAWEGPLAGARTAWDQGEYDVAESLYRQAIEQGGLSPRDVLDAYVRLGSTRAVLGKKESALAAFKAAALIDNRFTTPPEAGRKAVQLADRARRAESHIGPITLHADVPGVLAPGDSAQVDATLDPAHAAIATKVAIMARDGVTGKSYEHAEDSATSVHFKIPPSLALPDATLVIRVDALDSHANRLASVEQRVHVQPAPPVQRPLVASNDVGRDEGKKGGGFWSTAWPYVIGGAALAAGGAAVYFATRPGDDVNVGTVHVQLTH
jgi:hypothetical protein